MANKAIVPQDKHQAMKWLIWGGTLTGLFFFSNLNDPFNAPKSWLLSISGFWLLGWSLLQIKEKIKNTSLKWATFIAGGYAAALTIALIATDNKYIGFFGDYQRRTGYLSYISLIAFFLAASYLFDISKLGIFARAVVIIGAIEGVYGIAQHYKHDIVQWNNPYNSVLATLGNPDFAAAFMSIFLILNFGIAIQPKNPKWLRALSITNALLLFIAILFSKVRQGLLTSILGVAIVLLVWVYQRQKIVAYVGAGLTAIVGVLGIFGMLNIGPLSKFFYKMSVTYRGDYWRAGWRMFMHNPIVGVGLDRYGANFREFRDATQVARRGPNLVSNAAHSVPIQLASTGGVLVLLGYLALTLFIIWRGFISLKRTTDSEQLTIAVVFAAWIAYLAQSQISIDNVGIAVWGYLLGGAVVGLSLKGFNSEKKISKDSYAQPLLSGLFAISMLVFAAFFFQSETSLKRFTAYQTPKSQNEIQSYEALAAKPISSGFKEPSMVITVASKLAEGNDFPRAKQYLQEVIYNDFRNFEAIELLARINEYQKDWRSALPLREQIKKLDPFNIDNDKQLEADQKALTGR